MLAQFYPPAIGGEELHVRNLSIELVARGHNVSVTTFLQGDAPEFECDQGVKVYRIGASLQRLSTLFTDKKRQHAAPLPDPETVWELQRIIRHERPDIVHAHNWLVHSFTPLKAWSKARLVVTLHDCSLVCAKQSFVHREGLCSGPGPTKCLKCASSHYGPIRGVPITVANWVGKLVEHQTVDMFLPVSRAIAEATELAKHGLAYRVIPNFIPDDPGQPLEDDNPLLAQLPHDDYLLFVGDIRRGKGVEVLLRAYGDMASQVPLVLIGRLGADFSTNPPPDVHLLQSWPHAAIMNAWSRCSIALVPSIVLDACPTVALEAMAMGRPVVASRIGGLPDIVDHGKTGFLVTPGDTLTLQEAIGRLLDDRGLREEMGTLAKQRVVEFQARAVVPRIEQIYREVLQ
jgi:glycosyltransferase involved in cell wall biosynthesis